MCGIIGYIGSKEVVPILMSGLKKLEYRGYDSAGIAILEDSKIQIKKCKGKIVKLENLLEKGIPKGKIGLGHTRWATHGKPNNLNAHPHDGCNSEVAVVHNGIIENYVPLRERLISEGHQFASETDTEVLPHLIESNYQNDLTLAVKESIKEIKGSYAIGVISAHDPGKIIASRCGSPLIIGVGEGEMFLASDIPALLGYTNKVIFLEEKEIATITKDGVEIISSEGKILQKEIVNIEWDEEMTEKTGYKHFMLKEIFQETMVIRNNLEGRINLSTKVLELDNLSLPLEKIKGIERISILACGSSYYTALAGKYIFEELAGIPVEVDYSSEFRYKKILLGKKDLTILISQSGETADTIAALRACRKAGSYILALTNVRGSTISREADSVMYIKAGPEIGVATTKAFIAQLMCLYTLTLYFAQVKEIIDSSEIKKIISELIKIPQMVEIILLKDPEIAELSEEFYKYHNFLYLGRGVNYPMALEGALKLKEISYIHAEGYPAGEMKHGPIALLDKTFPVVVIVPQDKVYTKVINNIKEVKARDTLVLAIATEGDEEILNIADKVFYIPKTLDILYPILSVIPLQLFAYHIADKLGCDVDKPRNLAKSVTVE
ncbi:MAG: glutamine--fructose-6-phosphate transaminase (isomerizing) [Candidatus Caldatribacteriota bacterium]|nr:glutamine--fructose-6-phosphate transaminase (isomerizing) [Candidatus Caldatribacteriota bacterium]